MTHLPFIAASYALGMLVPFGFGVSAWRRMRLASRRLAQLKLKSGPEEAV